MAAGVDADELEESVAAAPDLSTLRAGTFGDFGSLLGAAVVVVLVAVAAADCDVDSDEDAADDDVEVDDGAGAEPPALNCSTCFITRTRTPIGMPSSL